MNAHHEPTTGRTHSSTSATTLNEKQRTSEWGSAGRDEAFVIFSKSGFVDGLDDDLGENWHLYDFHALDQLLTPTH